MMKKIFLIVSIVLVGVFTGCGGGGGGSSFSSGSTAVVLCSTGNYSTLKSGDTVVNDSAGTTVKILHNSNGTKSICVQTGSAHIE
jgi:ABC-type Fe3+-hydroxamate transport system substrate-binding protein